MHARLWRGLPAIVRSQWGLALLVAALAAGAIAPEYCLAQTGGAAIAKWVPTGNLNTPRYAHTATRLLDGRVLIVGGIAPAGGDDPRALRYLDSAELYDPVTGTWSPAGRLHQVRDEHTATLLTDGRVLVAGGMDKWEGDSTTPEVYDPATGTWTLTGRTAEGRIGPIAIRLQSGGVMVVFGAYGTNPRLAELYDPVVGTWRSVGSIPGLEIFSASTSLPNGQFLFAGGNVGGGTTPPNRVATSRIYDPGANSWNAAGNLRFARWGHTLTTLRSGSVLAAGGSDGQVLYDTYYTYPLVTIPAERFDPSTGAWTSAGALSIGRIGHTATLLANGEVLVAGGSPKGPYPPRQDAFRPSLSETEVYDPIDNAWRTGTPLNMARQGHTATRLADGRVLVAGGHSTNEILASAELYEHGSSTVPIVAAFTGSWYNPAQNGHGFMLEVLPGAPMRLLAGWFTFAPQGGQSWITGVGQVDGNQASVQAYQMVGSGGRFPPNFDAANVRQESWGTLTFTFSDCNHGHLDWTATAPGYGSGGMDLTRLTLPVGLTCQ